MENIVCIIDIGLIYKFILFNETYNYAKIYFYGIQVQANKSFIFQVHNV
jgi:hypothetical protein